MYWRVCMDNHYTEIPQRLLIYREKLHMKQTEFCQMLDITQNHYTAIETGKFCLTAKSIECFVQHGGDIGYILTGEETLRGITDKYISCLQENEQRVLFIKYVFMITKLACKKYAQDQLITIRIVEKYVNLLDNQQKERTIWENIRTVENLTQIELADLLEMDVKSYRKIEKMKKDPDAEILQKVYNKLGYSPWLFLNQTSYYVNEINKIWMKFPDFVQEELDSELSRFVKIIERYE